ncbi:MAG: Cupin domain protein [Acidobacteria bacterium ADurb.Bin340]|nr:MAG: Cupin domain protein [Acidobacteria bacterium ADurb.Bin340]HOD31850.1 cupin domain-containing protein [Holophaga sp.]HQL47884.1 cupin domain-containing protein [Holophaga sp.]
MQPEVFTYQTTDARIAEKVVDRPDRWSLLVAHVVLPPGEAMPPHPTNAEAFFVVVRGTLTLKAGEGAATEYRKGQIVHLPNKTPMLASNEGNEVLEFLVLKTPHPEVKA